MDPLQQLEDRLNPWRESLRNHPIYAEMGRLEALHIFMEHHIYAVWDFMSLLKLLQQRLCCVTVPWFPAADPQACRFINEIVLAEECDEDGRGGFASHFELYRRAMTQCGADTTAIDAFLGALREGQSLPAALEIARVPAAARRFVGQTFQVVERGDLCALAASFTFGREELLPGVFAQIVAALNVESHGRLTDFQFYLERHIGLDGDEHGPMATRLLQGLCGDDRARWARAETAAIEALRARQDLWDGIHAAMVEQRVALAH